METTDAQGRAYEFGPSGSRRYRMSGSMGSSARFGNCEVCDKPSHDMHLQIEKRAYDFDGGTGWTHHECADAWGHEACLLTVRY